MIPEGNGNKARMISKIEKLGNERDARLAFSLASAARALDVSVPFLRLEAQRDRLKLTRVGRRVLVTRTELERYLAAGEAE